MRKIGGLVLWVLSAQALGQPPAAWTTVGHDAQHTGRSTRAAAHFNQVAWSMPVDTVLAGQPGTLLAHYGSPVITVFNTVLVPVRTSTANTFEVRAVDGETGEVKYTLPTDYTPPAATWIPSYAPALSARNRFYYACAGGTVCYRDNPDAATGETGRIAFYGNSLYSANQAAFNGTVRIATPIVGDSYGNVFFGFQVSGANPAGLVSGLAKISDTGVGSWVAASAAAADGAIAQVQVNSAPALSLDHQRVYFAVSAGPSSFGYLTAVSNATMKPLARVLLMDPLSGNPARISNNSTASPVIGPDGDVYFGVLETIFSSNNARGWMLHFDALLSERKTPGAFGWDANASIVPRDVVPGYTGASLYLILTKYNNYAGVGWGDGMNRMAVLDPNDVTTDPVTGVAVMKEILAVLGPTASTDGPGVKEWCINTAAVDVVNGAAMVNSEDGKLYRWDFATNTLSEEIRLTAGLAEAYTPTVIGPDGTVYAINDAMLFAVR